MDVMEQLQEDLRSGRVDAQRLIDLIATVQRELQTARQRITDLEQRISELVEQLAAASGTAKLAEPFSLRAEEKRQQARANKRRRRQDPGRRGRVRTADKIAHAERTEEVYPDGVPPDACWLSHTRPV
jgi:transposase